MSLRIETTTFTLFCIEQDMELSASALEISILEAAEAGEIALLKEGDDQQLKEEQAALENVS